MTESGFDKCLSVCVCVCGCVLHVKKLLKLFKLQSQVIER